MTSSSPPPSRKPRQPFALGEVLSDTYELREEIGFGAMGQVIDAQDLRLNRHVAIKVGWTDQDTTRIRHEAQALAAIRHAGLPAVYALAVHRGHEYMVMERIRGVGFDEYLGSMTRAGESLPLPRVLDLLWAMADALAAVHGAGLVHRDLKPANIMLAAGDRVVLLDFGLFVPQFEPGKQDKITGSPWYMAPEIIRNNVEVGSWHLVDLYALGVVAFEMLAGQTPFPSLEIREVLRAHVRGEVPDISELRDDIPPALAALIRELLAKSPAERPPSAEAVLVALDGIRRRLAEDARQLVFDVLVASPRRHDSRTLAEHLRRLMPDIEVRNVARADAVFTQATRRPPDLALIGSDFPDAHPLELATFLRGTCETCVLGLLGAPRDPSDLPLLDRLGVVQLPELGGDGFEPVIRAVRDARRRRR